MKRILLLTTGGTIASQKGARGLMPITAGAEMLQMLPNLPCRAETTELMRLDSANIQPEEWLQMATHVYAVLDNYDGVVISHGTDTMSYSAAALSYMLRNLDKPVVLTGSQLTLAAENSDGPANLYNAFAVAAEGRPGVYVVFAGKIIRGCPVIPTPAMASSPSVPPSAPTMIVSTNPISPTRKVSSIDGHAVFRAIRYTSFEPGSPSFVR